MAPHLPIIALLATAVVALGDPVSFSREVLPILSDRCFHCHGPDDSHRKAKLRLDLESQAKSQRDDAWLIKAGDVEQSTVWQRIVSDDPDELMPPPDSHRKPLTSAERDVIRRWIQEGAPWGKHWAFEKPIRAKLPTTAKHPVDAFVRAQLQKAKLKPAKPATPETQLRRLSFALTGLPPSPTDVATYTKQPSDTAWQEQVDRLLASPHYGERMTMWWLDASRYADTDGFQKDNTRTNWPWRDWVINAFNANKPFDQFTIEQFAGDLLPDATSEQQLATCFHRNHMTNGEGGRHKEESRIDYVIDRVNTTGTVFLGLTLGCVQCHSHKFDPISHEDYYSLFAFFNNIDEDGLAGSGAKPHLSYKPTHSHEDIKKTADYLDSWKKRVADAEGRLQQMFDQELPELLKATPADHQSWRVITTPRAQSESGTEFAIEKDGTIQTTGPTPKRDHYLVTIPAAQLPFRRIAGWQLEVLPHTSHANGGLARKGDGNFTLEGVKLFLRNRDTGAETQLPLTKAVANLESTQKGRKKPGKVADALNDDPRKGWRADPNNLTKPHVAVFTVANPVVVPDDQLLCIQLEHRPPREYATIGRFRLSVTSDRGPHLDKVDAQSPLAELAAAKAPSPDKLDPKLRERLFSQYLLDQTDYQEMLNIQARLGKQLGALHNSHKPQKVQVLARRTKPRQSHILERGVWDAKGKTVTPAVLPAVLAWPAEKTKTRKDLADWLVHPDNPLTARVIVNQIWQNLFGDGLVRTPEDFGLQGEHPTHPDLLDWLAVEFVESDWDVKALVRLIVTSETFRQSSAVTPEQLERDPDNRFLARAPRYRLPAWMIRDNALAASGLLNPTLGGPPVFPWQPQGIWNEIFMGRFTYQPSYGPSQYRRTIYAFWRRASAPTFLFDSAQRRVCELRQNRTNTPLQALTLLNDVTMLEAARALADQLVKVDDEDALRQLSMKILSRPLSSPEQQALTEVVSEARTYYRDHPHDAITLTATGQQIPSDQSQAPETAAWMIAANTILNLDEAITSE